MSQQPGTRLFIRYTPVITTLMVWNMTLRLIIAVSLINSILQNPVLAGGGVVSSPHVARFSKKGQVVWWVVW